MYYSVFFTLEYGEQVETGVVQMKVNVDDASPKCHPVRCTLFAARQEIARQLRDMQEQHVITPSDSPWASPVVLVWKNGSMQFCIDHTKGFMNLQSCPLDLRMPVLFFSA